MTFPRSLGGCENLARSLHGEPLFVLPWKADHRSRQTGQRGGETKCGLRHVTIRCSEREEAVIDLYVGSVGDRYDNALAETINGLYSSIAGDHGAVSIGVVTGPVIGSQKEPLPLVA